MGGAGEWPQGRAEQSQALSLWALSSPPDAVRGVRAATGVGAGSGGEV